MKDTAYLKAKLELDNVIGIAARGQSLCPGFLVPLGTKDKRVQRGNNW